MRLVPLLCALFLLLLSGTAGAGQKSVIFYLDGARIEQEVAATKGYLEYPLPDSVTPGSLRVKPVGSGSVLRVEVVAVGRDHRSSRDLARLEERKSELEDRMEALTQREEIFIAAVKSQSGKTPRKSKTNPDPLSSLEQGTQFALAQLDAVNRSKRSCRRSLAAVETQLAKARKGSTLARIWLTGKRAQVSYGVSTERWVPSYDFRWAGDRTGEMVLHAKLPRQEKGVRYLVSHGTMAQEQEPRAVSGDFPVLSRYPLALQGQAVAEKPPLSFSFTAVEASLPPGEAAAFWRGEYLGRGHFAGAGASQLSLVGP